MDLIQYDTDEGYTTVYSEYNVLSESTASLSHSAE